MDSAGVALLSDAKSQTTEIFEENGHPQCINDQYPNMETTDHPYILAVCSGIYSLYLGNVNYTNFRNISINKTTYEANTMITHNTSEVHVTVSHLYRSDLRRFVVTENKKPV